MNPTNAASSHTSSTPAVSSLRPRTRRLISGLDEELGDLTSSAPSTRIASPRTSRPASPIPNKHPSRTSSSQAVPRSDPARYDGSLSAVGQGSGQDTLGSLSGLWGNSWTALQGLASNVLGSDIAGNRQGSPTRRRRVPQTTHRRITTSAPPAQWGPTTQPEIRAGLGSQEEREALVRARKRKDLLDANGHVYPDAVGNFKRRNSDDRISTSAPPVDQEDRDALVYVHRVRPEDTLAGITIKYNCQPAALRRANRMWPNDTIQSRKTIVLPVDACGVKGRPVTSHHAEPEEDLLLGGSESTAEDITPTPTPTVPNGWHTREVSIPVTSSTSSHPPSSTTSSHPDSEPPWKHESWVLLPNDTDPTEIARLPRRTLDFFPPARRKSLTQSDASTPSTSLDLPRPPLPSMPHASPASNHITNTNINTNPTTSTKSLTASHARTRPHRTSSASSTNPSAYPAFHLHGPGGVGTLSKDVRAPGPAPDGLNKLFAAHLPNVAPPPEQDYYRPWNPGLLDPNEVLDLRGEYAGGGAGGVGGGGGVGTGLSGGGGGLDLNLNEVGGAIEGWVRKMASKTATVVSKLGESAHPGSNAAQGRSGGGMVAAVSGPAGLGGASGVGDLIELTDAFEIGGEEGEEEGLREGVETPRGRLGGEGSGVGIGRGLVEGVRGRGRGRGRSGGGIKGGKGD